MRFALLAIVALGCKSSHDAAPRTADVVTSGSGGSAAGSSDMIVQPGVAEHALAFSVDAVHAGQQPSDAPPYYAPGGTWTYVEAHVAGDRAATFVVGLPAPAKTSNDPGFGTMYLVPTTAAAGARVIDAFARQFEVPLPPRVAGKLVPMKMPAALLGHNLGRSNGFSGSGTWDANKWFCSTDDIEAAEVFFNISLHTKEGELSEKDVEYSKDVAVCLAAALRDGVPPPRTPDNDPTLSLAGPKLVLGKQLDPGRMDEVALAPERIVMQRERPTGDALVEVDPATGAVTELYKTPDRIEIGRCNQAVTHCVIRETKAGADRNSHSASDPARLLLLEGRTVTPLVIPSLGKGPNPATAAVSPDGRWIVATPQQYNSKRLIAWNRATKHTVTLDTAQPFELIDWRKDGDQWVAILRDQAYDETKQDLREWHLEGDGKATPSKTPFTDDASPLSPDGKRRAELTRDGKLVITPLPSGTPRTLVLHPQDARHLKPGSCPWLDNRYIEIWSGKLHGLIDTDKLKVSFLDELADESARMRFGPLGRYAIVIGDSGTFLAALVPPK